MAEVLIGRRRRERQNTTAGWAASTVPLALGELGVDTDTKALKVGDGVTLWAGLGLPPSAGGGGGGGGTTVHNDLTGRSTAGAHPTSVITGLDAALTGKASTGDLTAEQTARADGDAARVLSTEKGAPNGVATLGADSRIPSAQLPPLAITDTSVVASQAAMLALTAEVGDVAIRSDQNRSYILRAEPATTLANWSELLTPTDLVLSVDGLTGAVALPVDGAANVGTKRTLGTGAEQALPGNHASVTNARTPTAHKASHATGGSDVLTPADIGAVTVAALAGLGANGVSVGPMWQEPSARVAWPETLVLLATSGPARPVVREQSPDGVTPGTVDYPVWLPAGTYKATVEMIVGPLAGISEVLLDGTTFGTVDAYSTVAGYPGLAFRPATAVTVATTGLHTVTVRKTGTKHASATGYFAFFVAAHLRKTG